MAIYVINEKSLLREKRINDRIMEMQQILNIVVNLTLLLADSSLCGLRFL